MNKTTFTVQDDKKTLVVERTFTAPRHKVWAAWTTPDLFAKWWAPQGWTTTVKHMDFTPGGYLLYGMTCQDPKQTDWYGKSSWGKSTYKNIDPENSFTYTDVFCDESGQETPNMPAMDISVAFKEENGATRLVSTTVFATPQALEQVIAMGMEQGLTQAWNNLETLLAA